MNFIESFFMVGILSGYFFFSAFVNDSDPGSTEWLNVYYLLSGLCIVAMLLMALTPMEESLKRSANAGESTGGYWEMFKLCREPLVYLFIICAFLYVLIEQSIMTWLPTFNSQVMNMPASLSIQMASILAGATALGRFGAGIALKHIDWFTLLFICLLLAGALVLTVLPMAGIARTEAITGWSNAPLAAFMFPLIGLCLAPIYPAINSVILSALPHYQHAPMAGLIVVFSALGGTTGSLITGTLFEVFDGRTAFYSSLLPLSLILFTLFLFKRKTLTQLQVQHV